MLYISLDSVHGCGMIPRKPPRPAPKGGGVLLRKFPGVSPKSIRKATETKRMKRVLVTLALVKSG